MMQTKPLTKFFVVKKRLPDTTAPRYLSVQDTWTLDHADVRIFRTRNGAQSSIDQRMLNADVVEVTLTRALFEWQEEVKCNEAA